MDIGDPHCVILSWRKPCKGFASDAIYSRIGGLSITHSGLIHPSARRVRAPLGEEKGDEGIRKGRICPVSGFGFAAPAVDEIDNLIAVIVCGSTGRSGPRSFGPRRWAVP